MISTEGAPEAAREARQQSWGSAVGRKDPIGLSPPCQKLRPLDAHLSGRSEVR